MNEWKELERLSELGMLKIYHGSDLNNVSCPGPPSCVMELVVHSRLLRGRGDSMEEAFAELLVAMKEAESGELK